MTKNASRTGYSTPAVFIAACAGMFFFGVAMLSLGPILGQLNQLVEGANKLPATMSIGIFLGTILFGPVVDRFGYKWLLIIGSILELAGLQGVANLGSIGALHLSIFCLGLGGGILNGETNALVSDLYDDSRRGGRLGLLGAFYCIGALVWVLMNYFISDYRIPLNILSAVMAGFIVYYCFLRFPEKQASENVPATSMAGLLKSLPLILFALVLFFESGFEGAQSNFTILYLVQEGGLTAAVATLAMTWFTVGMMGGRFLLGKMMERLGSLKTLYVYLSVALAGVLMMFIRSSSPVPAYVSMVLIGFGVGATFPVILNYIGGAFQGRSGSAISIAIAIALIGQYTFNFLTGTLYDHGNYVSLPFLLSGAILVMMVLVPVSVRASKK